MTRLSVPRLRLPPLRMATAAAPRPPRWQPPTAQDKVLDPEEEFSLLQTALGGVQYVGEMLGKPGYALKGLLATGDPEQLLHAVPFSDALEWSPKKYEGRELLHKAGLASRNKPGFRGDVAGDLAGFAVEVALDPLWLLAGLPLVKGAAKGVSAGAKGLESLSKARQAFNLSQKAIKEGSRVLSRTPPSTPAALAQQIRAGERGLVGLRLPFTKEPLATFGKGSKVGAWAVEKVAYGTASPLMWIRGMFSHTAGARGVKEFFGGRGGLQRAKDLTHAEHRLMDDAILDFGRVVDRTGDSIAAKFKQIAEHHGGQGDRLGFEEFTRAAIETGLPKGEDLARLAAKSAKLPDTASLDDIVEFTDGIADEFYEYIDSTLQFQNAAYERVRNLGGITPVLDDIYIAAEGHTARRATLAARISKGKLTAKRGFEPTRYRKAIYRNLPVGSKTVNAIARDPLLTGAKYASQTEKAALKTALRTELDRMGVLWDRKAKIPELQGQYLWKQHLRAEVDDAWAKMAGAGTLDETGGLLDEAGNPRVYGRGVDPIFKGHPVTREMEIRRFTEPQIEQITDAVTGAKTTKTHDSQVQRLVKHFGRLDPTVRERGIFDGGVLENALEYTKSVMEWESTLRSAHHFLAQPGVVWRTGDRAGEKIGGRSLREVWEGIRLKRPGSTKSQQALTRQGLETFVQENAERLKLDPARLMHPEGMKEAVESLNIAPAAESILDTTIQTLLPEVQGEFGKLIDRFNSLWKGYLFTPWPAAHTRNVASGFYNSWSDGHVGIKELGDGYARAYNYLKKGGRLDSLPILQKEGLLGRGYFVDVAGREAAEQLGLPGGGVAWALAPYRPKNIRAQGWSAADPFALRGWRRPTPEMQALNQSIKRNVPMEAGERIYEVVEFVNRVGYAEALLKKGYSASEIKHLVTRSQFDYSKLSKFEQNVVSRSVLFYGWPRNNVPFQISKLIARPGGRTAQTIRAVSTAAGGAQDPTEYTPSFLRERTALRFGGPPEEAQFFSASGLPIEEFNKLVVGDERRTAEKLLSYLHPLLQAPGELATGRQFFSGRRIEDLRGVTGIGPIDRLLHYAPVSRVVSEARGVLDTRKALWQRGLNATTGFKTSTYDTEYWRVRDLEKAIVRQMQEDPLIAEGVHHYVPKGRRGEQAAKAAVRRIKQHQALRAQLSKLREQMDVKRKKGG